MLSFEHNLMFWEHTGGQGAHELEYFLQRFPEDCTNKFLRGIALLHAKLEL